MLISSGCRERITALSRLDGTVSSIRDVGFVRRVFPQLTTPEQIPEAPEAGDQYQRVGPAKLPAKAYQGMALDDEAGEGRAEQQARAKAAQASTPAIGIGEGAATGQQSQERWQVGEQAHIETPALRVEQGQDVAAPWRLAPAITNNQTERVSSRLMGQNHSGGRS